MSEELLTLWHLTAERQIGMANLRRRAGERHDAESGAENVRLRLNEKH